MANILHFLRKALPTDLKCGTKPDYYLITAILLVASIPLGYAVSNAALGLFVATAIFSFKKQNFKVSFVLLLPVLLFALMCLSTLWTVNLPQSTKALSKNLPVILIPLCFMVKPVVRTQVKTLLKYYSAAMVLYAVWYLLRAFVRYMLSGNSNVFFYHELTTSDVNAIHVSLYMGLAFFYYIAHPVKGKLQYVLLALFSILILLLSSKSLIVTIFAMVAAYFLFFSGYRAKLKLLVVTVLIVVTASVVLLVPKIRERFLIETSTAFTKNTVNHTIGDYVYNVSINEAINDSRFGPNDYFPGVALRVFLTRIFFEMADRDDAWVTGYGVNAVQEKIREKVTGYNAYPGYGDFNFHNQYIQSFAELGVFGLLILLAIIVINAKNAFSRKDFVHISLAFLLITLFLTESLLSRQRGILFFMVFYCAFNVVKPREYQEIKEV